jgi:hypothetical protein
VKADTHSADDSSVSARLAGWLREPSRTSEARGWPEPLQQAARWALQVHGIAPLLHETLSAAGAEEALPPPIRRYLAEQHRLSSLKMEAQLADLDELLCAFQAADIAVMPLKGALLTRRFYARPGLRPSADIDLLIRDERAALALLQRLRYAPTGRSPRHTTLARPEHAGPVVSYEGEHPANPRDLDLHTRIGMRFWSMRLDITERAWRAATSQPWGGGRAQAQIMDDATLLLHLALHASEDMIARRLRLLQLHDIALVAPRLTPADWSALIELVRAQGEERLLFAPLALTARLFEGVPGEVLGPLARGTPGALRARIEAASIDSLSLCNRAPTGLGERLVWFRPGLERARALRHALLPNPGEVLVWFPKQRGAYRLPIAYARYAGVLTGWVLGRVAGRSRLMLRRRRTGG